MEGALGGMERRGGKRKRRGGEIKGRGDATDCSEGSYELE